MLVTSLAKDQGNVKILGLAISNGLVSLAGCVFAQEERVFEISMGTGAMVIGLASVIIGTSIFKKISFVKTTTAVLVGSIIYKACVAVAIRNLSHSNEAYYSNINFCCSCNQHGWKEEGERKCLN